jgi:hypothetical protein
MNAGWKRITQGVLALAIAGAATFAGAGAAQAAERPNVFSCAWDQSLVGNHEYLALINVVNGQNEPDCFANAGSKLFNPPEVAYKWSSGNNAGYIAFMCPGDFWYQLLYFDKNQGDWFCSGGAASAKVGELVIY